MHLVTLICLFFTQHLITFLGFQVYFKCCCTVILPINALEMSQKHHSHLSMFLLLVVFVSCWPSTFITCVSGQRNSNLDQPFILRSGTQYRDRLTLAASRAVAKFAKKYQRRQGYVVCTCL